MAFKLGALSKDVEYTKALSNQEFKSLKQQIQLLEQRLKILEPKKE